MITLFTYLLFSLSFTFFFLLLFLFFTFVFYLINFPPLLPFLLFCFHFLFLFFFFQYLFSLSNFILFFSFFLSRYLSLSSFSFYLISDSIEVEREFAKSKIKDHLKEIIQILRTEPTKEKEQEKDKINDIDNHNNYSNNNYSYNDDDKYDYFIQYHVIREFCVRAIKDSPKGILPLVLNFIASILQNVKYPFLPHITIHRSIANIIFFASHYESLQNINDTKSINSLINKNSLNNNYNNNMIPKESRSSSAIAVYKKRIGDKHTMQFR